MISQRARKRNGTRAADKLDEFVLISRRGLLRAGVIGTAAVWIGGILAHEPTRAEASGATSEPVGLSPAGVEILRAISPVVLADLLPRPGPERDHLLETGLANIDEYIAHLSSPLQQEVRDLFGTLDLWPVRTLLTRGFSRWSETSEETLQSFLTSARDSRVFLLRRIYAFLQSMVVLGYFDQQAAWKTIGYPGPPIERAGGLWGSQ